MYLVPKKARRGSRVPWTWGYRWLQATREGQKSNLDSLGVKGCL